MEMDIQPQYIPLHKLLSNKLFRIPRYQRAYSWSKKQRKDMFDDIRAVANGPEDAYHFMATVVGLRRETKTIVTDKFTIIDVVDGQQRLTTLVIMLKAIEQRLDRELVTQMKLSAELQELLVKQDNVSLVLLQTNHDRNHYFLDYIRSGNYSPIDQARTVADREILQAIIDCEKFVETWDDPVKLLSIVKNQLTFIFHELSDEATVYTVFEVLNNRGLRVSWVDRLKSILMSIAFEKSKDNADEHIEELHNIWGNIYQAIGLKQGLSTEALRFAATLRSESRISKPLGEADAVELFRSTCKSTEDAIELSKWLLKVTEIVDKFLHDTKRSRAAVTEISQARLLAIAILMRDFPAEEQNHLMDNWEKTSFRIFGLCRKDKRTAVGDYVRLAWETCNKKLSGTIIDKRMNQLSEGKDHDIAWAVANLVNQNCYEGWEDELLYLLYRYEEQLAKEQGQKFSNEQWNRIWEASAARSIEHILPQSKGSQKPVDDTNSKVYVHRLGNLLLLPPGLNSELGNKDPIAKADRYIQTGLRCAAEVGHLIKNREWDNTAVQERERKLLEWIEKTWA